MNVLVESFLETQLNIKLSNSKKKKNCFALPSQISKYKNDSFSRNTNIVTRMVQSDAFYTYFWKTESSKTKTIPGAALSACNNSESQKSVEQQSSWKIKLYRARPLHFSHGFGTGKWKICTHKLSSDSFNSVQIISTFFFPVTSV